jgi:hypothetical protein
MQSTFMSTSEYAVPYAAVRDGPSIVSHHGTVILPEGFSLLTVDDLTEEMRLVLDLALSIYRRWLVSTTILLDEQPRLLLTFRANVPEKTVTLRLNLGKLANELARGLSTEVLREALNILK